MRFRDRAEAGRGLAGALKHYRDRPVVVYALPRGGVVLGVEVARALRAPLDLIIPRKIGHPSDPEYAICAVAEDGDLACNESEVRRVDPAWFEQEVARERAESRRRRLRYLGDRPPLPVAGRTAILVDDGIATGLTMRAAIRDARRREPARLVVAIPVVPEDTAARLAGEVDEIVALDVARYYLGAVSGYYDDFPQITDDEVVALLRIADAYRNREERPCSP